ncbi:DEAD/DEAH box helicase [Candidatus Woesearchaeota archaeon]|nr:DEAD/DEAH box helicase [Candidatus Woesearchaeota archaeon]
MKFENLDISIDLLKTIQKLGYNEPTEIQEKSIPLILRRKDVIGESATGSGKTLAFGCGILDQVTPNKGLQALVLVPTRELAEQVKESLNSFSERRKIKAIAVYGGVAINPQMTALKRTEVVVATPGRLLDHMKQRTVNLTGIKILVLDEADRMLDMGFIKYVERIIQSCPRKRQTLFFSATISSEIKNLADKYMQNPIRVSAKKLVDPSKLKQIYFNASRGLKLPLLVSLLKNERTGLVMVFCNTRFNTDFVVKNLRLNEVDALAIHGGLTQSKRSKMMSSFSNSKIGVLVCTDVASRGLHIENVSHIYNYEIPKDSKDYIHRIGRTARAGESGKVINLLSEQDHDNFARVRRDYSSFNIEKVDMPKLDRIVISKREIFRPSNGSNGFHKNGFSKNRFHKNKNKRDDRRDNFRRNHDSRW